MTDGVYPPHGIQTLYELVHMRNTQNRKKKDKVLDLMKLNMKNE